MLKAVNGYYNGSYIVLNEDIPIQKGQKVIITLDIDVNVNQENKSIDLAKYMGRGPKMFNGEANDFIRELRDNDRL